MAAMRVEHALDGHRIHSMATADTRATAKPHSRRPALSMGGTSGAEGGGGHFGQGRVEGGIYVGQSGEMGLELECCYRLD